MENLREITHSAINDLSPREQEVLRMRYGMNDKGREYTLRECAEIFHISRERIRQIEQNAINKLRKVQYSNKLGEYSDYFGS